MMKEETHIFQGMKRDVHQIKQDGKFLWDAHNIRITSREDSTGFSITNEKGTLDTGISFLGYYVGHCVLGKYLVVFTAGTDGSNNYIYRVEKTEEGYDLIILFHEESVWNGSWNPDNPIEAIGVYETELVQKVYWVDGINQPRVINVAKPELNPELEYPYYKKEDFNFIRSLKLEERVGVLKMYGNGVFSPGTIQYAFSYYNKYGQESNLFYTTPLNYISLKDRGGDPEETVNNLFKIDISSVDTNFEYLRIYSVHRTSLDAIPTVKLLTDIPISKDMSTDYTISFIDSGTGGEIIDPMTLLYIGGKEIVASTLGTKDNTLFLGNIEQKEDSDWISTKEAVHSQVSDIRQWVEVVNTTNTKIPNFGEYYAYNSEIKSPGFKFGETYRCGIQLQSRTGVWSAPIFARDIILNSKYPYSSPNASVAYSREVVLDNTLADTLLSKGYVKARACVVLPSAVDRTIVGQGVICPTVFSTGMRRTNSPYAMSSWFFRPQVDVIPSNSDNTSLVYKGSNIQSVHNAPLYTGPNRGAEIQCTPHNSDITTIGDITKDNFQENIFFVDSNLVTFHSPDIEFDTATQNLNFGDNIELKILGSIGMEACIGDIDIQTSSPVASSLAYGFEHKLIGYQYGDTLGTLNINGGLIAGPFYQDGIIRDTGTPGTVVNHMVYPWHRSGSVNNGNNPMEKEGTPAKARSAVLSKKKISNLKFFSTFYPVSQNISLNVGTPQVFSSQEVSLVKVWVDYLGKSVPYYGNVDTLIPATSEGYTLYKASSFSDPIGQVLRNSEETDAYVDKSNDPVRIKYKSTPHLVFSLKGSTSKDIEIIPSKGLAKNQNGSNYVIPDWDETTGAENNNSSNEGGNYPELVYISNANIGSPSEVREEQVGGYAYLVGNQAHPKSFVKAVEVGTSASRNGWNYLAAKNTLVEGTIFKVIGDGARCLVRGNEVIDTGSPDSYNFYNGETKYFKLTKVSTPSGTNVITGDLEEVDTPAEVSEAQVAAIGDSFTISQKRLDMNASSCPPFLVLAELRRTDVTNRFGGNSEEALRSNLWIPAGESINLNERDTGGFVHIKYQYGDTWYSRYDCLKTYPFTQEDENSIVEIGSFMVETRVNIDGRYDRNRGQLSNLYITPQNFNLFNEVYSQKDNFFNYRILDEDYYKQSEFGNQITWSKEKHAGEEVDSWTNITLANTLDLDGSKGKVTAIIPWNELLLAFQEKGLNQLLFNSRVQIPVTDGVPIEISNGAKMDGSRLINGSIGCYNKWSICSTPMGVYFIDSNTASLYLFNGQLSNLSRNKGMDWWPKQATLDSVWKPGNAIAPTKNGIRTFYDAKYGDIYFTPGVQSGLQKDAICFSEALDSFVSQMSYGGVPAMFNFSDSFYSIKKVGTTLGLYENNAGDYNNFYGNYKGWDFSFISNDNSIYTKIFDTVDLRADHENKELLNTCPVNFIEVSNEYQNAQALLDNKNMRKKFRVWRGIIPRNSGTRERIRNPWAKITLGYNPNPDTGNTNKAIVHDVTVHYTI